MTPHPDPPIPGERFRLSPNGPTYVGTNQGYQLTRPDGSLVPGITYTADECYGRHRYPAPPITRFRPRTRTR